MLAVFGVLALELFCVAERPCHVFRRPERALDAMLMRSLLRALRELALSTLRTEFSIQSNLRECLVLDLLLRLRTSVGICAINAVTRR